MIVSALLLPLFSLPLIIMMILILNGNRRVVQVYSNGRKLPSGGVSDPIMNSRLESI